LRNYYELLAIDAAASLDDVKKAFRREIAKYHPDKVQHLGQEFQAMASSLAADLTEAYRILMDPELRAKYDDDLRLGCGAPEQPPLQWATTPPPHRTEAAQPRPASSTSQDRPAAPRPASTPASSVVGSDFVKRAAMLKLREAAAAVLGGSEAPVAGFDAMFVSKPKKGLFRKGDEGVRLMVRFVPQVDADAIADVWPRALRASGEGVSCVLLLGSSLAPAGELAASVTEQRRRSRNTGPVLVPVDVRDWEALIPPDTPSAVRAMIQRLREGKA
jgi:curved DNA-binding protein CbpA